MGGRGRRRCGGGRQKGKERGCVREKHGRWQKKLCFAFLACKEAAWKVLSSKTLVQDRDARDTRPGKRGHSPTDGLRKKGRDHTEYVCRRTGWEWEEALLRLFLAFVVLFCYETEVLCVPSVLGIGDLLSAVHISMLLSVYILLTRNRKVKHPCVYLYRSRKGFHTHKKGKKSTEWPLQIMGTPYSDCGRSECVCPCSAARINGVTRDREKGGKPLLRCCTTSGADRRNRQAENGWRRRGEGDSTIIGVSSYPILDVTGVVSS